MESLKTYFDFAENDFKYSTAIIDNEDLASSLCNVTLSSLTQASEKYLKHIIDISCDGSDKNDNDLMHSHNLSRIYKRVLEITEINAEISEIRWLGDFYFSARYPGDFYFSADMEDVREALDITNRIRESVISYIKSKENCKSIIDEIREENPIEDLRIFGEKD